MKLRLYTACYIQCPFRSRITDGNYSIRPINYIFTKKKYIRSQRKTPVIQMTSYGIIGLVITVLSYFNMVKLKNVKLHLMLYCEGRTIDCSEIFYLNIISFIVSQVEISKIIYYTLSTSK